MTVTVDLIVENNLYSKETVFQWTMVWERICRMAYENENKAKYMIVLPGEMVVNNQLSDPYNQKKQTKYYQYKLPENEELITFDHTWKQFSKRFGAPYELFVIHELELLVVPRCLFDSLGVSQFFKHSFPKCKITFWEE